MSEGVVEAAARMLAERRILGLYLGRCEYGPRALGARTIMASPADRSINDWLNKRLDRTEFMPFAPVVRDARVNEAFDLPRALHYTARYMTVTCNVRPEWRDRIPAVVHVDGTARPQVIRREDNPTYYDILRRFEEISGLPCAINTSFNAHEEPIINRPEEALRALEQGRVDLLVTETGIFANGPGAPAPTGHRIDASVDRKMRGLPCGLGGRPQSLATDPIAIAPSSQPHPRAHREPEPGRQSRPRLFTRFEKRARECAHHLLGPEFGDARPKAPVARGALQFDQLAREIAPCSKAIARVVDEFEMIAVAPALPDEHGLVFREELGDRKAERLARAARIQPGVAASDEIGDALPIARARQMDNALVARKAIGVEQHQPQVLATLQRRLDRLGDERHVELVARAMTPDYERVRGHAELRAQIRSRRRRIDDMRHGGIARPGRRLRKPRRDVGVGVPWGWKKRNTS